MRILISIIRFEPGRTLGSEVYLSSFLESLSKVIDGEEIAIVGSDESCRWGEFFNNKINWIPAKIPESPLGRMIFERNNIEKIARHWNAQVVFFPFNIMPQMKMPSVLLLHDLVNEFYCKKFPLFRPVYFHFLKHLVRNSVKKPDSIITISKAIADELQKLNLLGKKQKVIIVPLAVNQRIYKKKKPKQLLSDNIKFILQSGAQLPHKNHLTGVKAFVELKEKYSNIYNKTRLILTGELNNDKQLKKIIKQNEMERNVLFLGRLSQEELEWVMQNASIACFPTLYEGFGLGIVEAQLRKTPVIASDIPVLKEVSGNGAVFFEPENEKDLAKKIVGVLDGENAEIEQLIKIGLTNINKWTWENHCCKVLEVLRLTANS